MKIAILVAAVSLTGTVYAAERSFERTLTVVSSPNLTVTTGSGNIHLHPGSDSQIHISAHLRASNNGGWFGGEQASGDAESRMAQIANNPPIQQTGNSVTVGERNHDALYRNIAIEYDITLPPASSITANTGSGNIEIEDAGASLKADTGSGNVSARNLHGNAFLHTGSGDIELRETANADVRAETGSGNVHLDGVSGALRATTGSGDIVVTAKPATDWQLQTGSGNIRLDLGSSAHFTLNASTGSGSVNVRQPMTMQGSLDKHHVSGAVNGGGPTLKAGTGSGDIEIR